MGLRDASASKNINTVETVDTVDIFEAIRNIQTLNEAI